MTRAGVSGPADVSCERTMEVLHADQRVAWMSVLDECEAYDSYHLPGYHAVAESRGEGKAHLFVYREADVLIGLPLLLRPVDTVTGLAEAGLNRFDATSVYGCAGPIASRLKSSRAVVQRFQHVLRETLQELGVVAVFTRLHPLIEQREILSGLGECLPGGQTVSIDLSLPADVQRMHFRDSLKRGIERGRRLGLFAAEDIDKEHLGKFYEMYSATMRRVNAARYYFFEPEYFDELARHLGPALRLFVVSAGDQLAAGALCVVCKGIVQYHLGATKDEFVPLSPMKLLLDTVRLWATERGQRVFHLGGGVGSQADSLFNFKAGFSKRRHQFFTWRWVLDSLALESLCAAKAKWNAQRGLHSTSPRYFPPYRADAMLSAESLR
jgi:Acetyltransferase (GNAT) domain